VTCDANSDCASYGAVCYTGLGVCTAIECTGDSECKGSNEVCQNSLCVNENQQQCESDSDCHGQHFTHCLDNHCAQCEADSDCPDPQNQFCSTLGECRQKECSDTNPCPGGKVCIENQCRKPQCQGDSDCPPNQQCNKNGFCTGKSSNQNQCNNDADCPKGAVCTEGPPPHVCDCTLVNPGTVLCPASNTCVQKCPAGATMDASCSCHCSLNAPYLSSNGLSCGTSCGLNEGVVNGKCTPCITGQVACGSNPPTCQTQDDNHCGLSCQQCASNAACQNGQCTPVCPAGQQLCHPPTFIGNAQACGDTSTGVSTDANGNCQCPEGQDLVVPDLHTAQCVPKCPEGSTRDPNNPNNCICNDPAQTFCTNYNQCINLNSPESCGTPTATSNGISCDDVKTCAAPTGGTATCDSGQCGQTCSPVGDIQYEPFNGACVPKCATGATRDASGNCQCPSGQVVQNGACTPCPSDKPDACGNVCVNTHDGEDANCGGCGVDNPAYVCTDNTHCHTFNINNNPVTQCSKACGLSTASNYVGDQCGGTCCLKVCASTTNNQCNYVYACYSPQGVSCYIFGGSNNCRQVSCPTGG
jgi:hypothetical protein